MSNYKESILKRLYRFLFGRKNVKLIEETTIPQKENTEANDFIKSVKIEEDKEQKRILQLQKKFEEGLISEEDLTDEDFIKLQTLYEKQIEEAEQKLDRYKEKILEIRRKCQS